RLTQDRRPDLVFLALHGGKGEDGTIQALLDLVGIPYTGSGHLASALAMDQDLSQRLFRDAGVPTPDCDLSRGAGAADWQSRSYATHIASTLGMPVIVKPSKEGSTVGLTLVRS